MRIEEILPIIAPIFGAFCGWGLSRPTPHEDALRPATRNDGGGRVSATKSSGVVPFDPDLAAIGAIEPARPTKGHLGGCQPPGDVPTVAA